MSKKIFKKQKKINKSTLNNFLGTLVIWSTFKPLLLLTWLQRYIGLNHLLIMPPTSVGRENNEMMGGVCLSVCRVPQPNSRTEMKPKIDGMMEAHHRIASEPILR